MSKQFILVLVLIMSYFGCCLSHPLYDVYNVESEPPAIPLHLLRIPMQQVDTPNNEISMYENEIFGTVLKRTQNAGLSTDKCCPTVIDVIEPSHGKNRSGDLVELYQSSNVRQRFYENSCAPSVADHPCRFLERRHSSHSKCVQQYSYTYAMIRDLDNINSEWKLDYIQIRSGCSCHISKT